MVIGLFFSPCFFRFHSPSPPLVVDDRNQCSPEDEVLFEKRLKAMIAYMSRIFVCIQVCMDECVFV